jgi:NAD(P)-dependent dehydrogenase (short-subunit alcohol dehydrogenase family)
VNAIAPGWVLTEKQRRLWITPEGLGEFLKKQAIPRRSSPRTWSGPTLFLASRQPHGDGQVLAVDAGVVALG